MKKFSPAGAVASLKLCCRQAKLLLFVAVVGCLLNFPAPTFAHPLGNFTINHFSRLEVKADAVTVRYVVDMAEIPTFQELQKLNTGDTAKPNQAELESYLARVAVQYGEELSLTVDGARVPLRLVTRTIGLPAGEGGLPTLRVECEYAGTLPARKEGVTDEALTRRVFYENANHAGRIGWHEIVVTSQSGITIFDSTAFSNSLSDELKSYPENMLTAPLDERSAEFGFTSGALPANAKPLLARNGQPASSVAPDRFAELINVPEITWRIGFVALFIAFGLGALHAMSPGHGKAVVGAYLVGSRGTLKHAAFLGLTITVTHTLGVFTLGIVTLFASRYVVPETLFPFLSLLSGLIVLFIGLSLFVRRLQTALDPSGTAHTHGWFDHSHDDIENPLGSYDSSAGSRSSTKAGHTHLPPGADGTPLTWRSLLGLGISGGILPCPSALVVMLSAIALGRIGFGLVLIVAFSFGLAATLTSVGLLFLYAGRFVKRPLQTSIVGRALPAASAFVISCFGALICYEALKQSGLTLDVLFANPETSTPSVSTLGVLSLGLIFGFKHAIEADHIAAVTTIVSERKSILSSALVGGLWGVGHTVTLLVIGLGVILLHVRIAERTALALEFCVALMLVFLGANVIRKLFYGGAFFPDNINGMSDTNDVGDAEHAPPKNQTARHNLRFGVRPFVVGMIHGVAGSAALTLLVLSTIPSPLVGIAYMLVFGIGSIGGMMMMSALIGLPVHFTRNRFARLNLSIRAVAGLFSFGFGLFMIYQIGFVEGLLR